MRSSRALLLVAAVTGVGCSNWTSSITLTSAKPQLCAGGFDETEIVATVTLAGGGKKANVQVDFSLTGEGSFSTNPDYPETWASTTTDAEGEARVMLYAGNTAGTDAMIIATFSDNDSGETATATLSVPHIPPSPDCGASPASGSLRLACDVLNIGALRTPMPALAVPCHVTAATRDGRPIPAEALDITFLLEAGSMEAQTDYDGHRFFLYRPTGGARPTPKAVTPSSDLLEPSRFDAIGTERCPRQGLATLVAVVRGEEGWIDTNGNGVFDVGVDTFQDTSEPFVDMDDNGMRDLDEDYVDSNGDGMWTEANGQWDADTSIWAKTYILWTGPPAIEQKAADNAATHYELSAGSTTITIPGSLTVSLYLRDDNLNPVAGFADLGGPYEAVEFEATTDSVVTTEPYDQPIPNQLGFELNAKGDVEGGTFLGDTPYVTTLKTTEGWTGSYTVNFVVKASPGPAGADGYYLPYVEETLDLAVEGLVK